MHPPSFLPQVIIGHPAGKEMILMSRGIQIVQHMKSQQQVTQN
jgi:hypothetical protein